MFNAPTVFLLSFWSIIVILLFAGLCDFIFFLLGWQTISAWLRLNPGWYIWGSVVMLGFIVLLGLHLWYEVP